MPHFRKLSAAALFAATALLTGASIANAQDESDPGTPQGLAVEGLRNLMQALELFVKSVPQYSAPEVLPNGDIIIRRVHPSPSDTPPKSDLPDETHT
jgi:hypothetical protein